MKIIEEFIERESSAGIVLIFVTVAALLLKNSPLSEAYNAFLLTPVEVRFGAMHIDKPLLLWINDGLMAIFFLLIGLEVKREIIEGDLSSWSQVALPGIAALGGMAVPALIYIGFNHADSFAMRGWAIPTAYRNRYRICSGYSVTARQSRTYFIKNIPDGSGYY
jgi:NhaA family Na+:H+ antiporter